MPIVAMSSGTFQPSPASTAMNAYILGLAGVDRPRICFLPTAVGDSADAIVSFYRTFPAGQFEPSHMALFTRTIEDLRAHILKQHVIYVSGGNTANLLAVWRLHGLDTIMREAWENGAVLTGGSAGALCWFESGTTDSFGLSLAPIDNCLGFVAGSLSPHYDSEERRRPVYHRCIADGMAAGWALEDGTALHYEGTSLHKIVTSRQGARVYQVELVDGEVRETAVEPDAI